MVFDYNQCQHWSTTSLAADPPAPSSGGGGVGPAPSSSLTQFMNREKRIVLFRATRPFIADEPDHPVSPLQSMKPVQPSSLTSPSKISNGLGKSNIFGID